MTDFNPQRLSIARRRRAMSKKGVADAVDVTPNTILRYESGEIIPGEDVLDRLAVSLDFPKAFFFGEDADEPRRDNASFRGMASKSGKIMDAALASGALAFLLDDWFSNKYDRPEPNVPDLRHQQPETAAIMLRQHWRLGDKPIENMIHLLETNGVRVFSLAENTKEVDAFSLWRDDIPYVFLNRFKSSERSRFDAAHELAHLCLHKHGGASTDYVGSNIERDANAFAGAFLMPGNDVMAICPPQIYGVDQLINYKKRWRVSISALNYRLHELGLLRESRYNSNYVEMSRRGWLKNEPREIPRERSHVWQEAIPDLARQGVTKARIAADISVPPQEIEALLFGLASMLTIEGSGSTTPRRNIQLKVVKSGM